MEASQDLLRPWTDHRGSAVVDHGRERWSVLDTNKSFDGLMPFSRWCGGTGMTTWRSPRAEMADGREILF